MTYDQIKSSILADLKHVVCPSCLRDLYFIAGSAACFNCQQYVFQAHMKVRIMSFEYTDHLARQLALADREGIPYLI